jgi:hypothetical protein
VASVTSATTCKTYSFCISYRTCTARAAAKRYISQNGYAEKGKKFEFHSFGIVLVK